MNHRKYMLTSRTGGLGGIPRGKVLYSQIRVRLGSQLHDKFENLLKKCGVEILDRRRIDGFDNWHLGKREEKGAGRLLSLVESFCKEKGLTLIKQNRITYCTRKRPE